MEKSIYGIQINLYICIYTVYIKEGHDGPGVAHLSLLDCDSKI